MKPQRLGNVTIPDEELKQDKKHCRKFGPCGVGEKALYLNSFYLERRYYIRVTEVTRIFKRIAMSKGGFTGKGAFGAMPYLVVEYANGREKQCNFKHEEDVDRLLAYVGQKFPQLPLHSVEAERKLREKEERLREKQKKVKLSEAAQKEVDSLEAAERYLNRKADLSIGLSQAARKKRVYQRSNPAYKWVALAITLMGAAAFLYGIWSLMTHAGFGMYFLLFGLAAIFLFAGANVLPTAKNNRRYIEKQLTDSLAAMEEFIQNYPEFPVPAYYAHPVVLKRMRDILREGRAETTAEALQILKSDLKALNSDVMVEQEEYDEVVAIKPMFLVMDYQ